jgi:hypothetical protein
MERDHFEDLGLDGKTILKLIFKKMDGVMDWSNLAQSRDRWQHLVKEVINVRAA